MNSQAAMSQPEQDNDGLATLDDEMDQLENETKNVAVAPKVFNPPNPYATGMNFNQTGMNGAAGLNATAPTHVQSNSMGGPNMSNQPTIGASLMDQEAVTLNPNLMGKKKKVKKVKKARGNLMNQTDEYD